MSLLCYRLATRCCQISINCFLNPILHTLLHHYYSITQKCCFTLFQWFRKVIHYFTTIDSLYTRQNQLLDKYSSIVALISHLLIPHAIPTQFVNHLGVASGVANQVLATPLAPPLHVTPKCHSIFFLDDLRLFSSVISLVTGDWCRI